MCNTVTYMCMHTEDVLSLQGETNESLCNLYLQCFALGTCFGQLIQEFAIKKMMRQNSSHEILLPI